MFNFQRLSRSVFVELVYSALVIFAHCTYNQTKINKEIILTGYNYPNTFFFDL